jgi:hypothetical protein
VKLNFVQITCQWKSDVWVVRDKFIELKLITEAGGNERKELLEMSKSIIEISITLDTQ